MRPTVRSENQVWNVGSLAYVPMTQPTAGEGGSADSTAANQTTEIARLTSILAQLDVALSTRTKPADQQHVIVDSSAAVAATRPGTGTRTTVAAAAADTSLLAANSARFGSTVWNESDKTMYIALGASAASLTSYTAQVAAGGYYETPFNYTGAVRAIWATGPTGNARITEIT